MKGENEMSILGWIVANLATIIVFSIVILIVSLIIVRLVKNKKSGKPSCSCGCGGCPMRESCHSNNK